MVYQPQAKAGSFSPAVVPSTVSGLEANERVMTQSLIDYGNAIIRDGQTAVQNAKQVGKEWEALAGLSKTAGEIAQQMYAKQAEGERQEGLARAYAEGIPAQEQEEYKKNQAELMFSKDQTDAAAVGAAGRGETYEVVQGIKGLSGWGKVGYAQGKAKMAGVQYQGWMENQLNTNNTLELNIGGEKFTPATAKTPAQKSAAMAALRSEFYNQAGLTGMNPAFLNEFAFPQMHQADYNIINSIRKAHAIEQSEAESHVAKTEFLANHDFQSYIDTLATTLDPSTGKYRGYRGAWKEAEKVLTDALDTGMMTEGDIDMIMQQEIPGRPGKTWGSEYPLRFAKIKEKAAAHRRQNWRDTQADNKILFKEAEMQALQYLMQNPDQFNKAALDAIQLELMQYGQGESSQINQLYQSLGVEPEQKEAQRIELERKAQLGLLTTEDLIGKDFDLIREFSGIAAQQEKASVQAGNKDHMDAIQNLVETRSGTLTSEGKGHPRAALATQALQREYLARVTAKIAGGTPAAQAGNEALLEVTDLFNNAQDQPGHIYQTVEGGTGNPYPNIHKGVFTPSGGNKRIESNERTKKVIEGISQHGPDKVFSKEEIFTKAEAEAFGKGWDEGGWKLPPEVQALSDITGVPPLEILNQQRDLHELDELKIPDAVETAQQVVAPELQQLIRSWNDPQRSMRAYGGSGVNFEPSLIPRGLGDVVGQASGAYGIDPAILAGLIETESGWNFNAVSSAGAQGIAQFMPETAAEWGVDTSDPVSSIQGAARYLAWLRDQFGGNMDLAIYAYNGGIGNISKFNGPIPGSRENQEYLGKVKKAALKYGGVASGVSNFRMPSTMRPGIRGAFQVIEYVTGDIYHPNYKADHDNAQYHEHIAFATPEQARSAARMLRGMGYRITSTFRPGDFGYHGSGQAIDVGAPLDMPYDNELERQWSAGVRAIFSIPDGPVHSHGGGSHKH